MKSSFDIWLERCFLTALCLTYLLIVAYLYLDKSITGYYTGRAYGRIAVCQDVSWYPDLCISLKEDTTYREVMEIVQELNLEIKNR